MHETVIPSGYQQVMPYLIVNGAAQLITFVQAVFGAEERLRHMRDDHIIQHAEISIGGCVIMLADAVGEYIPRTGGFFIYVSDADAVYEKAMSLGAVSLSPVADQSYGRSGGITDPFGNTWWITTAV